jgi:hypothetical protein
MQMSYRLVRDGISPEELGVSVHKLASMKEYAH